MIFLPLAEPSYKDLVFNLTYLKTLSNQKSIAVWIKYDL